MTGHLLSLNRYARRFVPLGSVVVLLLGAPAGCYQDDDDPGSTPAPSPAGDPGVENTWQPDPDADYDGDGFSIQDGDCNDLDSTVYPGASEIQLIDHKDNDCDGVVDEGTGGYDVDGDGYGPVDGDCDDEDPTVNPGVEDIADGIDNDCDGTIDEGELVVEGVTSGEVTMLHPCDAPVDLRRFRTDGLRSYPADMAWIRDLDGDGYDELAISVIEGDRKGRVFLIYGGPDRIQGDLSDLDALEDAADAWIEGVGGPNTMGIRVVGGGDLDGDGFNDMLIGDLFHQRAILFHGGERMRGTFDPYDATATFLPVAGPALNVGFGLSIPGDVNGDGHDDLLIGQPSFDSGRGRVLLFYGGRPFSGFVDLEDADAAFEGELPYDGAGVVAAGIGDIDGDGRADFLVNAPNPWDEDEETVDYGALYLYYGRQGGFPKVSSLEDADLVIAAEYYLIGMQVSSGDFDGDGFSDFAIAYPWLDAVFVTYGQPERRHGMGGMFDLAGTVVVGDDEYEDVALGGAVALGGDLNGDGYDDLVVSTLWRYILEIWLDDNWTLMSEFEMFPGQVTVFPGGPTRPAALRVGTSTSVTVEGVEAQGWAMWPAATGGDLDGDGVDELALVGESYYELDPEDWQPINHTMIFTHLPL